ncbi:cytochrome c oxidase subunit 6B2 isoform 2 [Mus musculus]|uniref:Cytochrome c oxidase subunit 6B2 n=2 Tax=Mus TaxID=862507 RepID=S4R2Q6_MOUSE|nr:cytochrome c oxidase subunit 6B2 isoform 2 [Mus musculus]EDL31254.1 cytochrome c oxidase subunit VIb polypeptide 2, isoform CRA_a [Mus musculus]|eukprot:NP_001276778.1 cytochrome c oxidase subunit 6B2 isoform 2 [Mus musculus]
MLGVQAQKPPPGQWTTPPFDPRFPNQNQTRNCYQNFLDYHRCVKTMNRRGKSTQPCECSAGMSRSSRELSRAKYDLALERCSPGVINP